MVPRSELETENRQTMHHQRSKHALRLLRRGAYHYMLNGLLGLAALGAVVHSVIHQDEMGLYVGLGLMALWLLSMGVFFLKGAALRCSLCMAPLWSNRKCQKHRKVKPVLGVSYRLGIAASVVFKGAYRCPYCGEPFSAKRVRGEEHRGK